VDEQRFITPETFLGQTIYIEIDRPLGSKHPNWDFIYPVNYGFVPQKLSSDGEGLDAYVLGIAEPLKNFTGRCIAVIHRTDDDDDKLVVVPAGVDYTDEQIRIAVAFQEQFFNSIIIRPQKP
jgi:inorganic pyrophosphatase